jgi:hypothetical protein
MCNEPPQEVFGFMEDEEEALAEPVAASS